ncbi:hypothetical protein DSTSK_40940 [Desulforhabdus sp. TSK]|nr:hypothetical protein DSTSK_40940 [Desulforhabdus sp. TSK]
MKSRFAQGVPILPASHASKVLKTGYQVFASPDFVGEMKGQLQRKPRTSQSEQNE